MERIASASLVALVSLGGLLLQPPPAPADDRAAAGRAVRQIEDELTQAAVAGDTAALDHILAPDFFGVDADGIAETKSAVIERYRARAVQVEDLRQSGVVVRVYGDTAIVAGLNTVKARSADGRDLSGGYRFLHVYQKQHGRWQLIAGQGSRPH
jgi:ketosteroid isomerase-like protein